MQQDTRDTARPGMSGANEWHARLAQAAGARGSVERLDDRHCALVSPGSSTLLVTFETRETILRRSADYVPFGLGLAQEQNWSHLGLVAEGETWFRAQAVYDYFDDLIEDSLFDNFDRVVFFGAGMCGYAAAAYSVASPGATVVTIQPQATLDPVLAGWDHRFFDHRRLDFTSRYGFAPHMTEGAEQVFVLYDNDVALDAMHAALFARPWTTLLPCRLMGRDLAAALEDMEVTPAILKAASSGDFDGRLFRTFYRARRNHLPYLRNLLTRLDRDGRLKLAGLLARHVADRMGDGHFRARASEIEAELARYGESLPGRPRT